ncbi:MAG TPA: hypothetical protein VKA21_08065, partial [Candidatus Binatia bacterium]|nr:hypothetical protein [Candidatus Binatia bacterium]
MANSLTGDYEAVVQVRLQKINAILATLHQAEIYQDGRIHFPHSVRFQLGDSPLASQLAREQQRFFEWTSKAAKKLGDLVVSPDDLRRILSSKIPPGLRSRYDYEWRGLDLGPDGSAPVGAEREPHMIDGSESMATPGPSASRPDLSVLEPVPSWGRVDCQISNPTISIPGGAGSEVRVHVWVRAHFYRADGTLIPTEPVHGEIRAVYVATPVTLAAGPALRVQVTSDDDQIEFRSVAPLSAANAKTIITQVRDLLRRKFVMLPVTLPPGDVALSEFKTLGSGATEAVVLPVALPNGAGLPAGALGSVTNHLLGGDDFAVGVSKDYVNMLFDSVRESVRAALARVTIRFHAFLLGTTYYSLSLTSLVLNWNAGSVDIVGWVTVTGTGGLAPKLGYVKFTQRLAIVLVGQTVSVQATGDPDVDESWFIPHGRAFDEVKKARDDALPGASNSLTAVFTSAKTQLAGILATFDPVASPSFSPLEVTDNGIVVRGRIPASGRLDAVVSYGPDDATSMSEQVSAAPSWIPGGRIDSFTWSWVTTGKTSPLKNKTETSTDTGRFVWKKSAGAIAYGSVCLKIKGKRLTPDGVEEDVDAGEVCANQASDPPWLRFPWWWMKVHTPFWWPDPPHDFVVKERLAGHVRIVDDDPAPDRITTNVLVHFSGPLRGRPLERLARAFEMTRRRDASLVPVLVVPTG